MKKQTIIGIGGVSRSGKSTLARRLFDELSKKSKVKLFDQDEYVVNENDLPRIKNRIDWEVPESINWEKLLDEIGNASKFDYLIVEGIFAFSQPELDSKYDLRIYLSIEKNLFEKRKYDDKRWNNEDPWYINHIWKSHFKHGLPSHNAIRLDGNSYIEINMLLNQLSLN